VSYLQGYVRVVQCRKLERSHERNQSQKYSMSTNRLPDPLADKTYLEDLRRQMLKFAVLQLREGVAEWAITLAQGAASGV
jgi:phage gp37-like protein